MHGCYALLTKLAMSEQSGTSYLSVLQTLLSANWKFITNTTRSKTKSKSPPPFIQLPWRQPSSGGVLGTVIYLIILPTETCTGEVGKRIISRGLCMPVYLRLLSGLYIFDHAKILEGDVGGCRTQPILTFLRSYLSTFSHTLLIPIKDRLGSL